MSGRLPWVAAAVVIVIVAGLGAWALTGPRPQLTTVTLSAPAISNPALAPGQHAWIAFTGPESGSDNCAIENIYIIDNISDISTLTGDNLSDDWRLGTADPDDGENDLLDGAQDPIIENESGTDTTATIPYERPFKIVVACVLWADADFVGDKVVARQVAYINEDNAYVIINFTAGTGWSVADGPDGDTNPDENTQDTEHEYAFENDRPWTETGNYGGQNDSGLAPYGWAAAPGGLDNLHITNLDDYADYARVNFVFTDTETEGGTGEFQLPAGGSMNIEATLWVWV